MKERKTDHWKNSKFQWLSKLYDCKAKIVLCYVMFGYVILCY